MFMKIVSFSVCLLFLLVGICFGASQDSLMPPEVENLHLGMDWRSVVATRKNAQIANFGPDLADLTPDPNKPQEGLTEEFPQNSLFGRALYLFENGILVVIQLGAEYNQEKRTRFLDQAIPRYGKSNRVTLLTDQKDYAVVTWEKDGVQVNAMFPPSKVKWVQRIKPVFVLQIIKKDYAKKIKALGAEGSFHTAKASTEAERKMVNSVEKEITNILRQKKSRPQD